MIAQIGYLLGREVVLRVEDRQVEVPQLVNDGHVRDRVEEPHRERYEGKEERGRVGVGDEHTIRSDMSQQLALYYE